MSQYWYDTHAVHCRSINLIIEALLQLVLYARKKSILLDTAYYYFKLEYWYVKQYSLLGFFWGFFSNEYTK